MEVWRIELTQGSHCILHTAVSHVVLKDVSNLLHEHRGDPIALWDAPDDVEVTVCVAQGEQILRLDDGLKGVVGLWSLLGITRRHGRSAVVGRSDTGTALGAADTERDTWAFTTTGDADRGVGAVRGNRWAARWWHRSVYFFVLLHELGRQNVISHSTSNEASNVLQISRKRMKGTEPYKGPHPWHKNICFGSCLKMLPETSSTSPDGSRKKSTAIT